MIELSDSAFLRQTKLTDTFFKQIIDYENKIKLAFNMKDFQELVNLYGVDHSAR